MANSIKRAIGLKEDGELKESIALLQEKASENPLNIEVYIHLIHALSLNKEEKTAWSFLKKAEIIEPQNPILLAHKARLLLKQKKINEAFLAIQLSLNQDKNSAFSLLVLANIFRVQGMIDKAKQVIHLSIEANPQYPEAYIFRAMIEYNNDTKSRVFEDIKKALILKPYLIDSVNPILSKKTAQEQIEFIEQILNSISIEKQPPLLIKLGDFKLITGDILGAIKLFEQVVEIKPNLVDIHKKLANIFKIKKETYAKAIEHYSIALSISPNDFDILHNMATLQMSNGKKELAVKNFKKLLALNPNAFEAYYSLGNYYRDRYEMKKSFECYNNILRLKPSWSKTYFQLAINYMLIGELDKAIALYHTSLEYLLKSLKESKQINVMQKEPIDKKNASLALKKLHKIFKKRDIPFFLKAGTLLGIVRDGDILAHDKDIDIGLDWNISREIIKDIFMEAGFELKPERPYAEEWAISGLHKELGITADAFFYKELKDKTIAGFYGEPSPIIWEFPKFELMEYQWKGETWLVPNPPESHLKAYYGENWKIPDTAFDTVLSSYNLAKESKKLSICYGLTRLVGASNKNNFVKAVGYCQQLLAVGHDYPIIHKTLSLMQNFQKEFENSNKVYLK